MHDKEVRNNIQVPLEHNATFTGHVRAFKDVLNTGFGHTLAYCLQTELSLSDTSTSTVEKGSPIYPIYEELQVI